MYSTEEEAAMHQLCADEVIGALKGPKTERKEKFVHARWRNIQVDTRFDNAVKIIMNTKRMFFKDGDNAENYTRGLGGALIMCIAKDGCIMAPGSGSIYQTRGSGYGLHDTKVVPYNTVRLYFPFVETIPGDSIYFEAISNYIVKQFPRDHVLGMKKFSIKKWKKWKKGNDCYTFMGSK